MTVTLATHDVQDTPEHVSHQCCPNRPGTVPRLQRRIKRAIKALLSRHMCAAVKVDLCRALLLLPRWQLCPRGSGSVYAVGWDVCVWGGGDARRQDRVNSSYACERDILNVISKRRRPTRGKLLSNATPRVPTRRVEDAKDDMFLFSLARAPALRSIHRLG